MSINFKNTLCYTCFGCNKLEISNFAGAVICKNYIKAREEDIEEVLDEDEERLDDMFGKPKE